MDPRQANKRLIEELIDRVWRQGRIDELPMFWTTDCLNHADRGSDKRGLAALHAYHAAFMEQLGAFEAVHIDILNQVAEGDLVVTHMATRAVGRGSQRDLLLATMRLDRICDGKIAEHWSVASDA